MTKASLNHPAVLAVFAVLLCAPPAVRGASPVDVKDVVNKVQARYDATRDFTADVTQEMTVASLGKTVSARGTIAFKKPGKFRLELDHDEPQTIVADGSVLWLYQPNDQQVLKAPFASAFRSSTPISFLTGVGRIGDDFDAHLDGETPEVLYLQLTPRRADGEVGTLRLTIGRDNFEIRGAEIHDPLGNVSRLRFENIRPNTGLTDERFTFVVPPGVDVISAPIGQ